MLRSKKRREGGTPNSGRNRVETRKGTRGPIQSRERSAEVTTSRRSGELEKRSVSNKKVSQKVIKRSSGRKRNRVRAKEVKKRGGKGKRVLGRVSKSCDQPSRKTTVATKAADF